MTRSLSGSMANMIFLKEMMYYLVLTLPSTRVMRT